MVPENKDANAMSFAYTRSSHAMLPPKSWALPANAYTMKNLPVQCVGGQNRVILESSLLSTFAAFTYPASASLSPLIMEHPLGCSCLAFCGFVCLL